MMPNLKLFMALTRRRRTSGRFSLSFEVHGTVLLDADEEGACRRRTCWLTGLLMVIAESRDFLASQLSLISQTPLVFGEGC